MNDKKYSYKPRNIFRVMLALWRMFRDTEDLNANVEEAAIVEFAFNRSRWGKKIARWDLLAKEVAEQSPQAQALMIGRKQQPVIDVEALLTLPAGTLGHEFASHAKARGINPNLVETMPVDSDADWLMAWAYHTHDFWHLFTGYYYDTEGEFGVAGFYMGQLPRFSFIAFFASVLMLRTVWTDRDAIATYTAAFVDGYQKGRQAKCVFGLEWDQCYQRNLDELRQEWGVEPANKMPDLALAA